MKIALTLGALGLIAPGGVALAENTAEVPETSYVSEEASIEDATGETSIESAIEEVSSAPVEDSGSAVVSEGETPEGENSAWETWKSLLSPEVIAATLSTVLSTVLVVLCKKIANKAITNKDDTIKGVKQAVLAEISNNFDIAYDKAIKPLKEKVEEVGPVLDAFAKCIALMQENTPESKLALLELIQRIGNGNKEVAETAEKAKKEVERKAEEDKEKVEAAQAELEALSGYDGTSI